MARPRKENALVSVAVRLPPEAVAEMDRRADRRNQTRGDWLRDQLTKALLAPDRPGQQAQAGQAPVAAPIAVAPPRGDVTPRWKTRDAPKEAKK